MVYEKVIPEEKASFRCLEWNAPEFECPHHFHPEIEVTHIVSSRGERLVGDRFDTFAPGDLAMYGPGLPHYYKSWKSERAHSRVIQFLETALGPGFFDLNECRPIRQLIQESSRGLRFSEPIREKASSLLGRFFQPTSGALRISLLIELLDVLSSDKQREPIASHDFIAPKSTKQATRLEHVLNYIDRHWQENIRLSEIAKVAGLHPQSLSRYFRRHLGMTCQDYLIELRLSRAARELLEENRSISEVAFECGFNNLANFNRLFLARYSMAPRDYRRRQSDSCA